MDECHCDTPIYCCLQTGFVYIIMIMDATVWIESEGFNPQEEIHCFNSF